MANYSYGQSLMPEHELVELLWEDGQIVMQGQTNRSKKSSFPTALSYNVKLEEKASRDDTALPNFGQSGTIDSEVNDLAHTVPCASHGLNAPWINYPIVDSLENNCCSDLFFELTGDHLNSLSNANNNVLPPYRSNGRGGQADKDVHNMHEHTGLIIPRSSPGASQPSRNGSNNLFQLPQDCHNSSQSNFKSRVLDLSNTSGSGCCLGHRYSDLQNTRFQKQDKAPPKPTLPIISTALMNFPHFSQTAALVKANLKGIDRLTIPEKSCAAASTYPVESTLVESTNGFRSLCGIQGLSSSTLLKEDSGTCAEVREDVGSVGHSEAQWQKDSQRVLQNTLVNRSSCSPDRLNCRDSSFAASTAMERHEVERGIEAVVASSSVCSGYCAGATSSDPKQKSKRGARETEESGDHSDDVEDEFFAPKKHVAGRGAGKKRSRAAEIHNLSERRRRDRINEKMRALQELIPYCNKVDKASMLDEAIEYLKTLQLQVQFHVQMMSMRSGLCLPTMMFPAGMNIQHMRATPMPRFSPMGVGMGIGMGMGMGMGMSFGMGMIDPNSSSGLTPVPLMHEAAQFPCPGVPGLSGIHRMPPSSSSIHSIGIPGQRLPLSAGQAPLFNFQGGLPPQRTMMNTVPVSDTTPSTPSSCNNAKTWMQATRIQKPRLHSKSFDAEVR